MESSFGLVRVLTWDIWGHLSWVGGTAASSTVTGAPRRFARAPGPGDASYWTSLAPLLRLLLHRSAVSEPEVVAHLIELGEPTLAVLDGAAAEPSLRGAIEAIRAHMTTGGTAPLPAPGGAKNRGALLRDFVAGELVRFHPYDPAGAFGRRLFLFGPDLEPTVALFLSAPNARVRRNAAAALARYGTPSAAEVLRSHAATTTDSVVLMRTLSALSAEQDGAAVVARLARALYKDRIEQAALVGAAGRLRAAGAVPRILELGRASWKEDTDLLMGILAALARIRPERIRPEKDQRAAIEAFLDVVERAVRANPRGFHPSRRGNPPAADFPDTPDRRARVLIQLVLLARLRLDRANERLVDKLLELPQDPNRAPPAWRVPYESVALKGVQPYARLLYIELLRDVGERGEKRLRALVTDRGTEPALRGHALAQLSHRQRTEIAAAILTGDSEPAAVRIHAFSVLASDGSAPLERAARRILADSSELPAGGGSSEERYLVLAAIRALDERGSLSADVLEPLLRHARAAQGAFGALPERVRGMVEELVRAAGRDEQRVRLARRMDEILDLVVRHGINPRVTPETRSEVRTYLDGQLQSIRARRSDPEFERTLIESMTAYVLGIPVDAAAGGLLEFRPPVPLEEEILLSLGRTQEPEAVVLLREFLENRRNVHRGAACLALGLTGSKSGAATVASYLLDEDPFVRLCAYEALRRMRGRDFFADWLAGPEDERRRAAEAAWKWIQRNP